MIILSFAVLYRMKMLRKENIQMTTEIINYSKLLKNKNFKNKEFLVEVNMKKLSLRERQIFNLILSEKSNKEIADIVHISVNTVKFHVKNIYDKLKIKSRKEALNL
jgi:ATP/maltotriose-dependent transcriptional regulator MalT